jgi:16S rRNA processing protein RimM
MTELAADSSHNLVVIARAVRTRGLKGEVVADLLTDFPNRFEALENLTAVSSKGELKILELENFWFQKNRVILKFKDHDDVDKANAELVGWSFAVAEEDRVPLEEGEYYDWELEGCVVQVVDNGIIGQVRSILKTGGTEILSIIDSDGNERFVPLAAEMIVEIDVVEKKIIIDPPEGLLDL